MKTLISFVLFVALLHTNAAAQNLSGIWKGKMTVDTPRYDINFEMALDDKNGKLSGYITRTVVLNDTFFYSLVKVKATMREDRLVVEDVEMVSNNFPERRSGIKQTTVFFLDQWRKGVNVSILPGNWSTNRMKGFMGLSGVVQVERQENYVNTQIFRRMEDQNLLTSVSFIKPEDIPKKEQQMVAVAEIKAPAKGNQQKEQPAKQLVVVAPTKPADQTPAAKPDAVAKKPTITEPIAKKEETAAVQPPVAVVQKPAVELRRDTLRTAPQPTVAAQQVSTTRDSALARNDIHKDNKAVVAAKDNKATVPPPDTQPVVAKTETQPAAQSGKPATQQPSVQQPSTQPVKARNEPKADAIKTQTVVQPQQQRPVIPPVVTKTETQPAVQPGKPVTQQPAVQQPTNQPVIVRNEPKPDAAKPQAVTQQPVQQPAANQPVAVRKEPVVQQPVVKPAADSQAIAVTNLPAVQRQPDTVVGVVQSRPAELINTFDVRSDSLVLALYDNGEIDGDTVSVFVNDQLVISKQGLSATAFRKTIYFEPGMRDSIKLVLFAENLGRIPPNTGLLLVNDGDLRYEVYFSANLKSSSAIILRRRKTD